MWPPLGPLVQPDDYHHVLCMYVYMYVYMYLCIICVCMYLVMFCVREISISMCERRVAIMTHDLSEACCNVSDGLPMCHGHTPYDTHEHVHVHVHVNVF